MSKSIKVLAALATISAACAQQDPQVRVDDSFVDIRTIPLTNNSPEVRLTGRELRVRGTASDPELFVEYEVVAANATVDNQWMPIEFLDGTTGRDRGSVVLDVETMQPIQFRVVFRPVLVEDNVEYVGQEFVSPAFCLMD